MKKLILSLMFIGCFSAQRLEANLSEYAAKSVYYLCRGLNVASAFASLPKLSKDLYNEMKLKYVMRNTELIRKKGAEECPKVQAFFEEKLKEHHLDPSCYLLIQNPGAYGPYPVVDGPCTTQNIIYLTPQDVTKLKTALDQPQTPNAQATILEYSATFDHEIGHIKHHDTIYIPLVNLLSTLAIHYVNSFVLQKICPSIYTPQRTSNYLVNSFLLLVNALCKRIAFRTINLLFGKLTEYRADGCAITAAQKANDPGRLHATINYLTPYYWFSLFGLRDLKEKSRFCFSAVYTGLAYRLVIHQTRKKLARRYAEQKSKEEFGTWVEKQTDLIDSAYDWIYFAHVLDEDPHPTPNARRLRFAKAAQELELQQKLCTAAAA